MPSHMKSVVSVPDPAPISSPYPSPPPTSIMPVKGANQGRILDPTLLELPGCFDGFVTGHLEILETPGCVITMARQLTCLAMLPCGGGGCYHEETFTQ